MPGSEQRAAMGTAALRERPKRSLRLHHREPIVVVELMGFVWRVVVSTVIRQFIYWLFRSPSNRRR